MAGMTVIDPFAWNAPWKNKLFSKENKTESVWLAYIQQKPKIVISHTVAWNLISSKHLYDNATGSGSDSGRQP